MKKVHNNMLILGLFHRRIITVLLMCAVIYDASSTHVDAILVRGVKGSHGFILCHAYRTDASLCLHMDPKARIELNFVAILAQTSTKQ